MGALAQLPSLPPDADIDVPMGCGVTARHRVTTYHVYGWWTYADCLPHLVAATVAVAAIWWAVVA